MLHDFISSNREELISRTSAKVSARPSPPPPRGGLEHGVPLFLTQLSETLRLETLATPFSPAAIGAGAARHGRERLAEGYSISQVVHDYADACETTTDLAVEKGERIRPEELHALNRCLDTAIAEGVTEYARLKEEASAQHDLRDRGEIAHELRNVVQTALLSFRVLASGKASADGSAGAALGRSLGKIRELVDRLACPGRGDSRSQ